MTTMTIHNKKSAKHDQDEMSDAPFYHLVSIDDTWDLSQKKSTIEVLRVGKIHDRDLTITMAMLEDYVKNWKAGVYGSDLQVNLSHDREGPAAAWVTNLFIEGDTLKAEVEWTPLGESKVTSKEFRYTSSELRPSYPDSKSGEKVKNVFVGVALTNVPAVKGMAPVTLSEKNYFLLLNSNDMNELKKMHSKLMAQKSVSKEDMDEFKKQAAKYDEAEGGDEGMQMHKKLASKKADEKEESEGEGEPDEDDKPAKKTVKNSETTEKTGEISLAEFEQQKLDLAEQRKKTVDLEEKLDRKDLSERVEKELVLSGDRTIGFTNDKKTIDEVVKFAMSLEKDQREGLFKLLAEIKHVDLSTIGGMGVRVVKKAKSEDEVLTRAKQLLNEGKAKDIAEAQDMAFAEVDGGTQTA